jgi:aminoglycoside 6-adenylyltransferase
MPGVPAEEVVVAELVAWGESDDDIRALVLTSTRAQGDGSADELSDYDLIVAVRDPDGFVARQSWSGARGPKLVGWGDESELLGERTTFRGVVYPDGVRVDFTIWPASLLERIAAADAVPDDLDLGYRVLADKDGATSKWGAPTYRAYIPEKPTQSEFEAVVDEFWWSTTYVAKALWRGEVVFAKFVLDQDAKLGALRRVLEWRSELDHDWKVLPGVYGRKLERLLPPALVDELHATYVGADIDENWDALFRTTALFRRVATEVAGALGYRYPLEADEGVTAQLEAVRQLPPKAR